MNEIAYSIGEATDEKVIFSFSPEGMHRPIANGDMIKALFDDYGFKIIESRLEHTLWWNAPYKAESEET